MSSPMKALLFFLLITLLLGCSQPEPNSPPLKDYEILSLPITLIDSYGPFQPSLGLISRRPSNPQSPFIQAQDSLQGIPASWKGPVVKQIWINAPQVAYQTYHQGFLSEERFEKLRKEWPSILDTTALSASPINCLTHIVMGNTQEGNTVYKIDLDNDKDFSDEATYNPPVFSPGISLDSLAQFAHPVSYQTVIQGKITEQTIPLLILKHPRGNFMFNFVQHATSEFQGLTIPINSGFLSPTFPNENILLSPSSDSSTQTWINRLEFLSVGDHLFQNLGVDFSKQVLLLQKMPNDSMLTSSQVGFFARGFSGEAFRSQQSLALEDLRGKYVYLDFWGTWCAPCLKEMPELRAVYQEIDTQQVAFLGIAADSPEDLQVFLEKEDLPWPQLLADEGINIPELYSIIEYPTSFLIDPEGKIVAKNVRADHLRDTLNYFLP